MSKILHKGTYLDLGIYSSKGIIRVTILPAGAPW